MPRGSWYGLVMDNNANATRWFVTAVDDEGEEIETSAPEDGFASESEAERYADDLLSQGDADMAWVTD